MTAFVSNRRFLAAAYLLAMTFCNFAMWFEALPKLRNGYQDFTIYYTSGLLLRNGQASALYSLATQYRTQLAFARVPIRRGPLPYNHPAFEALLFVPFTLLEFWPAYLLWTALNLIMLAASVTVLRRQFPQLMAVPSYVLGLGATAFFPVAIGIMQGQDAILLLLLLVLAVVCLARGNDDRGRDALAGAFLAAGLFRPHMVVPVVVLLALRRSRILVGFVPAALVLGGISAAITGWRGQLDYVWFVLRVEKTGAGGFGPQAVPNLRGLVANLPGIGASRPLTALLIFATSAAVFGVAFHRIWKGRDSVIFSFSLAVITTILISFHALSYDLTLLLPLVLFLLSTVARVEGDAEAKKGDARTILLVALLFLTPLYVFLVIAVNRFFLFSLILVWLYLRLLRTPAPAEAPA